MKYSFIIYLTITSFCNVVADGPVNTENLPGAEINTASWMGRTCILEEGVGFRVDAFRPGSFVTTSGQRIVPENIRSITRGPTGQQRLEVYQSWETGTPGRPETYSGQRYMDWYASQINDRPEDLARRARDYRYETGYYNRHATNQNPVPICDPHVEVGGYQPNLPFLERLPGGPSTTPTISPTTPTPTPNDPNQQRLPMDTHNQGLDKCQSSTSTAIVRRGRYLFQPGQDGSHLSLGGSASTPGDHHITIQMTVNEFRSILTNTAPSMRLTNQQIEGFVSRQCKSHYYMTITCEVLRFQNLPCDQSGIATLMSGQSSQIRQQTIAQIQQWLTTNGRSQAIQLCNYFRSNC